MPSDAGQTTDWQDPRIIPRRCGGYLAISNDADPVKIGVTAASEAGARLEFSKIRDRWDEILAMGKKTYVIYTQ